MCVCAHPESHICAYYGHVTETCTRGAGGYTSTGTASGFSQGAVKTSGDQELWIAQVVYRNARDQRRSDDQKTSRQKATLYVQCLPPPGNLQWLVNSHVPYYNYISRTCRDFIYCCTSTIRRPRRPRTSGTQQLKKTPNPHTVLLGVDSTNR